MFTGKKVITIHSGQYHISDDPNMVIYTLLGSCIAVCLYDEENGVGGMNHFMLPEALDVDESDLGRFGLESMEIMSGLLLQMGAEKANLKAKVFGGAKVINYTENDIASANIRFILGYLKEKNIPITAQDLGDKVGRKVYYVLENHSVFIQRLGNEVRQNGAE